MPSGSSVSLATPVAPTETADDPSALYRRGMALLERYDKPGHIDRASETFKRAMTLDGDSAPAHAGLARA